MPAPTVSRTAGAPGMYLGPTTIGKRTRYCPALYPRRCWYSISIVIAAPGAMFATDVVNTFGRSCSTRLARLPSCFAAS